MNRLTTTTALLLLVLNVSFVSSWTTPLQPTTTTTTTKATVVARRQNGRTVSSFALFALGTEEKQTTTTSSSSSPSNVEETTKKLGLEAGLFQAMKQNDSGESAKSLLKKYGIAYLATSIPLALVSFALCYLLVDNGVDVAALLAKVGIENAATEKAGTFAIAYAAHKAASPIRFPPTVLLTPVVARLIGKEPVDETTEETEKS